MGVLRGCRVPVPRFTTPRTVRLPYSCGNEGGELAAELGASQWLDGPDLPEPQRKQYELQQRIRAHLVANNWPQGFSSQQLIQALGLINDRGMQTAVGSALQLLGYKRVRLSTDGRPYAYMLSTLPAVA